MATIPPFHLAIPVDNLELCRIFYRDILNCKEGRSSENWVDFNFYGHQLVIHCKPKEKNEDLHINPVDGKNVPVPHLDRKSTRLNSSHVVISYAVFCLKKKKNKT